MILAMMVLLKGAFMIDREEYLSPDVEYEGDTVQLSFVFIKTDGPWHFGDEEGVHLLVILYFYREEILFYLALLHHIY